MSRKRKNQFYFCFCFAQKQQLVGQNKALFIFCLSSVHTYIGQILFSRLRTYAQVCMCVRTAAWTHAFRYVRKIKFGWIQFNEMFGFSQTLLRLNVHFFTSRGRLIFWMIRHGILQISFWFILVLCFVCFLSCIQSWIDYVLYTYTFSYNIWFWCAICY